MGKLTSLSRIPVSIVSTLAAVSVSRASVSSTSSSSFFSVTSSPPSFSSFSLSDLSCSESEEGGSSPFSWTEALTLKASRPNFRRRSKTTWRAVVRTSSWSSWATWYKINDVQQSCYYFGKWTTGMISCKEIVTWRKSTRCVRANSQERRAHKPKHLTAMLRTKGSSFWTPGRICRKTKGLSQFHIIFLRTAPKKYMEILLHNLEKVL